MKRRGILVLGAVVCGVAVGVACSGSESTDLSDGGTSPTTTSTSTGTTPPTNTVPTTPPADAAPPGDASTVTDSSTPTDASRTDAGTSMSFFVTSTGSGNSGGNLGGLAGADAKCQTLATAAGAGGRTWRAYLSITGTNARDRIGTGPWYNQKGTMIAADIATLHANQIPTANMFDEKGAVVPTQAPNEHDILTGTNADGTANASTCEGWTSNAGNRTAIVGHHDSSTTAANATDRWNNAHVTNNCASFTAQGGSGRFYCFATN